MHIETKSLNLALQGGGAHGAFTWGVLERLLADERIRVRGISGTSAGAVNGVLLASGLLEGGPERAQAKLEAFWRRVSYETRPPLLLDSVSDLVAAAGDQIRDASTAAFDIASRFFSPYQFNALDYNPMRAILEELVDFGALRRQLSIRIYIAATDVASGGRRVFQTKHLTVEAVLASACLPQLSQAVKVGARHYWDGGFTANPLLLPLVLESNAQDTLLVQLIPTMDPELPRNPQEIRERLGRIVFSGPLRSEVELIELGRTLAAERSIFKGRLHKRFAEHRFHLIDAGLHTQSLAPGSRLNPERKLILDLRNGGAHAAETWLEKHLGDVGTRATVDLRDRFL